MAIKTFTTGEVLTASDTNTYLANSGLVFVKQQTVGAGVGSVTVSNAFSATYDNYVILDNGGSMSVDTAYRLTFGASATLYYSVFIYASFLGGAVTNAAGNSLAYVEFAGGSQTRNGYIELQSPFLANNTEIRTRVRYGTVYGTSIALHGDPSSFSSFTLTPASGTMTGGTISVYGYRKG
jgi:hypothetical protein